MNKQNLLKAIELAENPGECEYFSEGKPSCVVGQLFVLEGAKEEEIRYCNDKAISNVLNMSDHLTKYLDDYPVDLLELLQDNWDSCLSIDEKLSDRKNRLVELVNNYDIL